MSKSSLVLDLTPYKGGPVPVSTMENIRGMDVSSAIRYLVASQVDVPAARVFPHTQLVADLGFDSLDLMELVVACEHVFGTRLDEDRLAKAATVGQFSAGVLARISQDLVRVEAPA